MVTSLPHGELPKYPPSPPSEANTSSTEREFEQLDGKKRESFRLSDTHCVLRSSKFLRMFVQELLSRNNPEFPKKPQSYETLQTLFDSRTLMLTAFSGKLNAFLIFFLPPPPPPIVIEQ